MELLTAAIPGYRFEAFIGAGGMGLVYRAWQPELERTVAIKVFPDTSGESTEQAERFRTEGRAMAKLEHPNVVAVHSFGEATLNAHSSILYLVMEVRRGLRSGATIAIGRIRA